MPVDTVTENRLNLHLININNNSTFWLFEKLKFWKKNQSR